MKKIILVLIILMIAAGGAFAQRNMIYGGPGAGAGFPCVINYEMFVSYEFAVIPQLSLGLSAAIQMYPGVIYAIFFDILDDGKSTLNSMYTPVVEGQIHWYPMAKSWHLDLGVGYSNYLLSMNTLLIAPGMGWRIDFGKPGGFIMNIGLRAEIFVPLGDSILITDEGDNLSPFNYLALRIGFGYRF